MLDDSQITAHQLLAQEWEVVVVSYEFLERNHRRLKTIEKRPTCALFSDLYRKMKKPIKRLVLDEAHRVKTTRGARHKAVQALYFDSCLLLSGIFVDNRWEELGALLQFLKGHPFLTMQSVFFGISVRVITGF